MVFWTFFVMSTVLLQITMLNLLIAIMGDTFDRVLDMQEESQIQQICQFIDEYSFILDDSEIVDKQFLIEATSKSPHEASNSSWEGKISVLRTFIQTRLDLLEELLEKKQGRKIESGRVENEKSFMLVQKKLFGL